LEKTNQISVQRQSHDVSICLHYFIQFQHRVPERMLAVSQIVHLVWKVL